MHWGRMRAMAADSHGVNETQHAGSNSNQTAQTLFIYAGDDARRRADSEGRAPTARIRAPR